jgi:hypothetical protein
MTSEQYQAIFDQLVQQGFHLTWVSTYAVNGQDLYAAIWDKSPGPAWQAHHRMTPSNYQATFNTLLSQGYQPACVSACNTGGEDLYAALWQKQSGAAWVAHHGMSSGGYQYLFDQLLQQGYRLRFVSGFPGTEPAVAVVKFPMQRQTESEWCWAAASVSVAHYYDANSSWTQCKMVNAQTGRSDCCQDPGSSNCNQPGYLDDALSRTGHLASWNGSTASMNDLLNNLSAANPVCIRIGWSGGGGHFIAATGSELSDTVIVNDPLVDGTRVVTYDTLAHAYDGNGTWTHSYHLKP